MSATQAFAHVCTSVAQTRSPFCPTRDAPGHRPSDTRLGSCSWVSGLLRSFCISMRFCRCVTADDETSSGDVTRLGGNATEAAVLRPLHRQASSRDTEPAPYFAWQPVAGAVTSLQLSVQPGHLCGLICSFTSWWATESRSSARTRGVKLLLASAVLLLDISIGIHTHGMQAQACRCTRWICSWTCSATRRGTCRLPSSSLSTSAQRCSISSR